MQQEEEKNKQQIFAAIYNKIPTNDINIRTITLPQQIHLVAYTLAQCKHMYKWDVLHTYIYSCECGRCKYLL